jgi:enamine deaminase RidA (YjgF/YER057c/UK114 family)
VSEVVQLIRSPGLADVVEYAYAANVAGCARLVFAAGACPLDHDGNTIGIGSYADQARQAMDNLRVALHDAGATLSDVVKSTIYVASTDRADLLTAWRVVRSEFGEHDAPSTLVGVTVLGYDGQLVEVEAIAAISS